MKGIKLFGVIIVLMVAATVAAGLWIAGSPSSERARRFDDQRMNDLQQISSAVDAYQASYGKLPAALATLTDPQIARYYNLGSLTDPETSAAYDYAVTGEKTYRLCATFAQPSVDASEKTRTPYADPNGRAWQHTVGRQCFDLVVPPKQQQLIGVPAAIPPTPIK